MGDSQADLEESMSKAFVCTMGNELEDKLTTINKTSLMIAYERSLEANQAEPLFVDPFATALAGSSGVQMSDAMAAMATTMGFPNWPEYHKTWTCVRTAFIDNFLNEETNRNTSVPFQFVNLGAGVDTRTYRMECFKNDRTTAWEVDLPAVNEVKSQVIAKLQIDPMCKQYIVDVDLSTDDLTKKLEENKLDRTIPIHWLLEGIIMYLPFPKQHELLEQMLDLSVQGSTALINFAETDVEEYRNSCMTADLLLPKFKERDWDIEIHRFGEPSLNFGRYPKDKEPVKLFSFAVCRKL